ncbi:MAG: SDR family oxidoreductase [Neomegalonema sp.]|nr:SDR family oxidoreductase [Neomegalonema sp.]
MAKNVLVLGAYGLIGSEICRALTADGWRVVGLGRSERLGRALLPPDRWITADLAQLTTAEDWAPLLAGMDAVVNAAGALQDGPRDDLSAVHGASITALAGACEHMQVGRLVQISAPGASESASTAFLRTKAVGDEAVRASHLHWTILRPALVLGETAYGGSALLRMLASAPLVQPLTLAQAQIGTVALEQVGDAVAIALKDGFPNNVDAALVEPQARTLEEIVLALRAWLGVPAPMLMLRLPAWLGAGVSRLGDAAIALGWRSALSSTSFRALRDGVQADPSPWREASGQTLRALPQTLAATPPASGALREARLQLLTPLMILSLSFLWLASGLVSLFHVSAGLALLAPAGLSQVSAWAMILIGGFVDCVIGVAVLRRPWSGWACIAMLLVTLGYLVFGTVLTPWLWVDPLAPLAKAVPAAVLAMTAWARLGER